VHFDFLESFFSVAKFAPKMAKWAKNGKNMLLQKPQIVEIWKLAKT